jgi:hypothetical protein
VYKVRVLPCLLKHFAFFFKYVALKYARIMQFHEQCCTRVEDDGMGLLGVFWGGWYNFILHLYLLTAREEEEKFN